jgi:hypothetical protein
MIISKMPMIGLSRDMGQPTKSTGVALKRNRSSSFMCESIGTAFERLNLEYVWPSLLLLVYDTILLRMLFA